MLRPVLERLLGGIPLVLGVTLVSFVLMVYYGPDLTYTLLSKNPTADEIARIRAQLGYDQPFWWRYLDYLRELVTLDFGHSFSSGERVTALLARTLPVTVALVLPGFALGNLIAIALGLIAAWNRGGWIDRLITAGSVISMSISFLIVIIAFQALFGVVLGLFPVRGWNVHDLPSYLHHVTVPTLATLVVALGYNTRFFRAVLVEESDRDHVRTARAFGASTASILLNNVLRNALVPIVTRIAFSIPLMIVSGSLLIERHFGIPGLGMATHDAILSGDQPVLKAVVGLSALLFALLLVITDLLYRWLDPRIAFGRGVRS
jgi:peptide/nickel transport system permease protein